MRIFLGLILLAYPVTVYLLLDQTSPLALALLLAAIGVARLLLARQLARPFVALGVAGLILLCGLTAILETLWAVKLYPVALSLAGAVWCAYTLIVPPNAIARLLTALSNSSRGLPKTMRDRIPLVGGGLGLSDIQMRYLRALTGTWLIFFAVNGIIALLTVVYGSTADWALYNGFLSYLVMGALLLGEYLYRGVYQRRHGEVASPLPSGLEGKSR